MSDSDPLQIYIEEINSAVAKNFSSTDYINSYIAFIDILGMKELVKREYSDLRTIFNAAIASREFYGKIKLPNGGAFVDQNNLRMAIMSDAIVLSIDANLSESFSKLAGFTSYLVQRFLKALSTPIFVRGGITRGLIYQDNFTVFGPGLVEAYNLENEAACYMRCIVSPALTEDKGFQKYISTESNALIVDPADGFYFIKFAVPHNFELLTNTANQCIESDIPNKIKEKYIWLLDYVNREKSA